MGRFSFLKITIFNLILLYINNNVIKLTPTKRNPGPND